MTTIIQEANSSDKNEILALYKSMIGYECCPWTDHYPGEQEIEFDLSRNALFVMKDEDGRILAAISLDDDPAVTSLSFWSKELAPGAEFARLAVAKDMQNQGIARQMLLYGMEQARKRGFKSAHFLVNKANVKALRSYEKLQFNMVGECYMFEQDFWCYEKEL